MQKIRDRARRRYLNKTDKRLKKGSGNQILHLANPFAVKENAVIRGMPQEEQDAYIRNKSISSGLLLGTMAAGFYTFWKREESAAYVLRDGGVMSKDQYLIMKSLYNFPILKKKLGKMLLLKIQK